LTGFTSEGVFKPLDWQRDQGNVQSSLTRGKGELKMARPTGRPNIASMTLVP